MEAYRLEEEEECFDAIDKLISEGINAGDVKKLQDAGIYTCNWLIMHTKKSLTGIKGLSEAKVDKICEAAEKLLTQGFMTGSDLLIKRKSVVRITTGSQALDELLGGGIETLCITEAFGEFRSEKTQLAHTLCVSTQLPLHMHGGNGKVAYIDTEGTFRPERIVPIAERFGMDDNAFLHNIIFADAYTEYSFLLGLAAKMAEEPFRLLIVDSVIALFRVDFSGRGELVERQQKLAQMPSRLTETAEEGDKEAKNGGQGDKERGEGEKEEEREKEGDKKENNEGKGEKERGEGEKEEAADKEGDKERENGGEGEKGDDEDAEGEEEEEEAEEEGGEEDDEEEAEEQALIEAEENVLQPQQQQQQQALMEELISNYELQGSERETVAEYRLMLAEGDAFQFAALLIEDSLEQYQMLREAAAQIRLSLIQLGVVPEQDPPGYNVFP